MQIHSPTTVPTPHRVVELDRLGDEIAELSAHLDAATARLLELIRAFDARGGWNTGFRSCASWLSWRVGLDLAAARESLYQRTRERDRTVTGFGNVSAETPTPAQQRADALALLAETALHHGLDPGAPGERYQVVVHVDAPVLADPEQPGQSVLEGGTHVSAETSQRLACDASRVVMRHDGEGRLLEVGARTRTIPPALRRALDHRDQGCRFPGCGLRFTQGHHLRHWAHGGPTTLSNLALLCRRHHRAVHEEGYQVARLPDGTLQFRRPNGHPLPEVPPLAAVPEDPVKALHESHDAQGLHVTARTGCPSWLGEGLNVGWASDVLHPLAQGSRSCLTVPGHLVNETADKISTASNDLSANPR